VLTGLTVAPELLTIAQGQTGTLTATGSYSDGSTQDLTATATWTETDVSGSNVASVASGQVLGKSVGQASITAAVGGFSSTAVVTVNAPMYTALAVTPIEELAFPGMTIQFTATATLTDGSTADVTALATWSELDQIGTGVATINSTGLATAASTGLAAITAAFSGFTASTPLIVF